MEEDVIDEVIIGGVLEKVIDLTGMASDVEIVGVHGTGL